MMCLYDNNNLYQSLGNHRERRDVTIQFQWSRLFAETNHHLLRRMCFDRIASMTDIGQILHTDTIQFDCPIINDVIACSNKAKLS